MVVLKIHTKYLKVDYKTTLLSKGTLFVFITSTLGLVLPFILAYNTGGFWLKRDHFYEQPNVKFKGEYMFYATTNNLSHPILCGTNPFYNELLSPLDMCTNIKVREIDDNQDTKIDELHVIIDINLSYNLRITSFTIVIPLDYTLHTVCPLNMESGILYQQFLPVSVSKFFIMSNLEVFQAFPLNCYRKKRLHLYNQPILGNTDFISLDEIINEYSGRNLSTRLSNIFTNFKTTKSDLFTIDLKVRYAEHKVVFKPKFWHIVKWAWIQYLAIYIIIAWIISKIKKYIFDNKLVLFYETPLKIK
ncbi:transmembrane protein 231 [Aethina tumida]|uniref:transmembrane protein 231 n=1 Tax=Aethina tumida TaxID=116153 RepID=UPI0021481188|nr:transmembrane protein 231 [Aethina tumida]